MYSGLGDPLALDNILFREYFEITDDQILNFIILPSSCCINNEFPAQ